MTNVIHANMRNQKSFAHTVCKEVIHLVSVVMYFPRDFYLVDAIDKKISLFLASGIMSHLIEKYVDMRYWNVKLIREGAKELKIQHLRGAFILWAVLNFCSTIIFIMEVSIYSAKRPQNVF